MWDGMDGWMGGWIKVYLTYLLTQLQTLVLSETILGD